MHIRDLEINAQLFNSSGTPIQHRYCSRVLQSFSKNRLESDLTTLLHAVCPQFRREAQQSGGELEAESSRACKQAEMSASATMHENVV